MSRRRSKSNPSPQPPPQQRKSRNTRAERPFLTIGIAFLPEGKVEIDPKYNEALVEQLDVICGDSEEYDVKWEDDHKIAYYIWTLMDGFLAQWDPAISNDEVNAAIPEVPHIRDVPVVDRFDIDLEILK